MCFPRFLLAMLVCLFISNSAFIALTTVAWADEGELLWQDQLHRGFDFGTSVTAQGNRRVFAAGFSQSETAGDINFIRAYHARTGRLLWDHESAKADSEDALLAVHGDLLFASRGTSGISAHDIQTGAVVWEDIPIGVNITDITAKEGLVVVVGYRFDVSIDFLVRAYDSATGTLLWDDEFDSGNNNEDRAFAVAVAGGRVFVAGETLGAGIGSSFLLRAYKSRTGELLWEDSRPGSSTSAFAVISHIGIVAIAGTRNLEFGADPFVRAYDARKGRLLWQHEIPTGTVPTIGFFDALAVQGHRLFAAGSRGGFLVQAYDVRSGALLWRRQSQADFGVALAVTASHGTVYAAGLDNGDWLVEAYEGATGDVMWEDRFDNGGLFGIARDDEVERGRLFVVGEVQTPTGFNDFLIRAYDADGESRHKARHSRNHRHFKSRFRGHSD